MKTLVSEKVSIKRLKMKTRLHTFENNLNDSFDKINYLAMSLRSNNPDLSYINEDYAYGLAKVLDTVLEDLKSAKEIYETSKIADYIDEIKKEVEG